PATPREQFPASTARPLQQALTVRTLTEPRSATGSNMTCIPLVEALARDPAAWEQLRERSRAASPFAGWAWHRAWADSASEEELQASTGIVVRDARGRTAALLPVAVGTVTFRRRPVAGLSWAIGGGGTFSDPRVERLHRTFAAELSRQGRLWLTTLDLDGTPAAAWYGFADRDTVYFYQSGRDPRWEEKSVGVALMVKMIRRAIERGYRRFDFL